MRISHFIIALVIIVSLGCEEEQTKLPKTCEDLYEELETKEFKGTVYVCNAKASQKFIAATVKATIVPGGDSLEFSLVSEDAQIDTVVVLSLECKTKEQVVKCLIFNNSHDESGFYNDGVISIPISIDCEFDNFEGS